MWKNSSSIVHSSLFILSVNIENSSHWMESDVCLIRLDISLLVTLIKTHCHSYTAHTHTHRDFVIILLIDTNFQNKESRDARVTYLRVICHWMKNAGARELRPLALISIDMCKSNSWMKAEQASRRWILNIPALYNMMDRASNESSRVLNLYIYKEGHY